MLRAFVVLVALAALGGASGSANPCDEAMNACASACAGQGQEVMKNFCALTPLGLVKACVCASQTPSVALPEGTEQQVSTAVTATVRPSSTETETTAEETTAEETSTDNSADGYADITATDGQAPDASAQEVGAVSESSTKMPCHHGSSEQPSSSTDAAAAMLQQLFGRRAGPGFGPSQPMQLPFFLMPMLQGAPVRVASNDPFAAARMAFLSEAMQPQRSITIVRLLPNPAAQAQMIAEHNAAVAHAQQEEAHARAQAQADADAEAAASVVLGALAVLVGAGMAAVATSCMRRRASAQQMAVQRVTDTNVLIVDAGDLDSVEEPVAMLVVHSERR